MYGRGVDSIAEQIKGTKEEAQKIIDDFYASFPQVKKWMDESVQGAKQNGYVEGLMGRRRRLPDIQLPKYTVEYKDKSLQPLDFNPILHSEGIFQPNKPNLIDTYRKKLDACKYKKDIDKVKGDAEAQGIKITNNGAFISQAERQCVNARIQGSAATITKLAMIDADKDAELNRMKFQLAIPVHDELIGECPREYAKEAGERLAQLMIESAGKICGVPMKCDADIMYNCWYENEYSGTIREWFTDAVAEGKDKQMLLQQLYEEHCEKTPEELNEILEGLL